MAVYTEPPEVVTGQTMTATNWNSWVRTNFQAVWVWTTAGDIAYASAANQLSRLGIGGVGALLLSTGSAPAWLALGTAGQALRSDGTNSAWGGMRGASVKRTTNQSIATSSYTAISWNSEVLDTAAFYASGSPTRFTIPRTSNFLIGAKAEFAAFGYTGYGELKIYKNGSSVYLEDSAYSVAAGGVAVRLNTIGLLAASAGDYFEAYVWQNTGDTVNLSANRCFFYIIDVGP
ncbi:MAG: hypothetical protein C4583_04400 [Anaerolineaceae bacterium]|nr:MAG: hypothetical protein C4583_04400 [Anaerolineaceae bacterium]